MESWKLARRLSRLVKHVVTGLLGASLLSWKFAKHQRTGCHEARAGASADYTVQATTSLDV
jgi:hypothetical protein